MSIKEELIGAKLINQHTDTEIAKVLALLGTGDGGDTGESILTDALHPAQLLADYKLYGVDSFVYNTPTLWSALLQHPYTANDRWTNGDALEYILTTSGAMALPAWLASIHELTAQASLFAGLNTAAALAGNQAAMTAVVASEMAMCAMMGSETMWAAIAASSTAVAVIAASEATMNLVCGDADALQTLAVSETAMAAVRGENCALAKLCAAWAGSNAYLSLTDCAALVADAATFNKVVAKTEAFRELMQSSTALTAIAASKAALRQVVADKDALGLLEASSTAKAALAASKLKTTKTYVFTSTETSTSANMWLIGVQQSTVNSTSYTIQLRSNVAHPTATSVKMSDCYNKLCEVGLYESSSLYVKTTYASDVNVTLTYIPLT